MEAKDYWKNISQKFKQSHSEKLSYGDPVEAHGKSFIPVTKTIVHTSGDEDEDEATESVHAQPVGFLEVTKSGTKFIPVRKAYRQLSSILMGVAAGFVLARLMKARKK